MCGLAAVAAVVAAAAAGAPPLTAKDAGAESDEGDSDEDGGRAAADAGALPPRTRLIGGGLATTGIVGVDDSVWVGGGGLGGVVARGHGDGASRATFKAGWGRFY